MPLSIPATSALKYYEGTPNVDGLMPQYPMTWSIWCRVASAPDATMRAIFSFANSTLSLAAKGYNLICLNSKLHFYLRMAPASWVTISALANLTVGQWYHCAGRVWDDGVNVNAEFFIDGVSQGTATYTWGYGISYTTTYYLYLGQYLADRIDCTFEEFAVWGDKLTDAQIAILANRIGAAPRLIPASLIGYWSFEELNDGENAGSNPKNMMCRGGTSAGIFQPGGSGNAYGRSTVLSRGRRGRIITFDSPAVAAKHYLACAGVGN